MHPKNRLERRKKDWSKAIRKKKISDQFLFDYHPYYSNIHQYSKNKIHCSCPMCTRKTRKNKTWYDKKYTPPISDLRKMESLGINIKKLID